MGPEHIAWTRRGRPLGRETASRGWLEHSISTRTAQLRLSHHESDNGAAHENTHRNAERGGSIRGRRRAVPPPSRRGAAETRHRRFTAAAGALLRSGNKGEFRLGNGRYCYPLTLTDFATRYLLTCEALSTTQEPYAFVVFEGAFKTSACRGRSGRTTACPSPRRTPSTASASSRSVGRG